MISPSNKVSMKTFYIQTTSLNLGITSAREAVVGGVIMNSLAGNVKAKTTHATTNQNNAHVHNSECNLPRRGEPLALVDVQPVHTTKAVTEPTSEQRANETQQITEDGNGIGNDPGNNPASKSNANPGANGKHVTLVHAVSATEQADVDVLKTDVTVDDTSTDNL